MKQYAIFDQGTGEYSFYDCSESLNTDQSVSTKDKTTDILAKKILDIHLTMTVNHPICIIIEEVENVQSNIEYKQYDVFGNLLPDFLSSKLTTAIFQKKK
jgi:hypothetical protein